MGSLVHHPSNPFEVAIFDLDGLLVDSRGLTFNALDELTRSVDMPASQEDIARVLASGSLSFAFRELLPTIPVEEAEEMFYQCEEKIGYDTLVPYDGTLEVIEALHVEQRMHCAVNTNRAQGPTLKILDQFGMIDEARFGLSEDLIVCPSETIRPKPAPDGNLFILKSLGLDPHQAICFGDTTADVESAKKAGIPIIAHTGGYESVEELRRARPGDMIRSIRQLPSSLIILRELANMNTPKDRL